MTVRLLSVLVALAITPATIAAQDTDIDRRTERELAQAQRLLERGRTGRARIVLQRSLRRSPSFQAAQLSTRLLPELAQATSPTERELEDARWVLDALAPFSSPAAERARAHTLTVLGEHRRAIEAIRVRAQDQEAALTLERMASLFVARRALRDAELATQQALRIMPQSRELRLGLAALSVARGRPESAVQMLLGVLALDPNDHVARRDLAGAMMAAGRHNDALTTLRELQRQTGDAEDALLLADAALELGRHRVAEEASRTAIASGSSTGYATLALALAAQGRRAEALQALAQAPDDVRARRARRVLEQNAQ